MAWFRPQTLLDKTYEIGIIIKGIDGVAELIGGILLLAVPPSAINDLIEWLAQSEFGHEPHSFVTTHILQYGHHLAEGHNAFAVAFLLTHGLVKVVLVACLLRNKLWAYPFGLVTLGLFIAYQLYEMIVHPTFGMGFLTVLDAIIIWLVWREWQQQKRKQSPQAAKTTDAA
ncbi:MAG TPA: DUF2127 domain-containing protein [Candidatus Saccharimonadales bacterium]|nr:DUF2127 domain-containing protein [Candidatus Saccharimonadales bacterium]